MKYLLMIYGNHQAYGAMSPDGFDRIMRAHKSLTEEITASGELIETNELSIDGAKIVRTHDGVVAITDGPFIEVKEMLAGYYLVECANVERAIEIAGSLAESEFAPIEVRRIGH